MVGFPRQAGLRLRKDCRSREQAAVNKDDKGLIIETLYNDVQQSEAQCGAALPAEFRHSLRHLHHEHC